MSRCLVLALALPLASCAYFGDSGPTQDAGILDPEVGDALRVVDPGDVDLSDALDGDFSLVAALPDGTREVRIYTGSWELESAVQTNLAWAHRAASSADGFTIVLGGGEMTKLMDSGAESPFPPEDEIDISGPLSIAVTGGGVQIGGEPEYTETDPSGRTSDSGNVDGSCWMDITEGADGAAVYLDMIGSRLAVNLPGAEGLRFVTDLDEFRLDHVARARTGVFWLANTHTTRVVTWSPDAGTARVVNLRDDFDGDVQYIRSLAPAGDGGALALVHDSLESLVLHIAPDGTVEEVLSSGAEIWYDLKPVL